MDFRRLTYFCAIVEEGSIAAAARRLNISQPPLSIRLKELEDEIGTPLILRNNGRWSLTASGKNLYKLSQHILKQVNDIPKNMRAYADNLCGQCSIAVTHAAYFFFLSRMAELLKSNPLTSSRVLITDDSGVEAAVQNGSADIGVTLAPLKFNNYHYKNITKNGYIVVYPKSLQLPDTETISLEDIKDYPVMLQARWEGTPIKNLLIRNAFRQLNRSPNVRLETSNPHLIMDLIKEGVDAVGIIHDSYLDTLETDLQWKRFNLPELIDEIILITRDDAFISPLIQKAIDVLVKPSPTSNQENPHQQSATNFHCHERIGDSR